MKFLIDSNRKPELTPQLEARLADNVSALNILVDVIEFAWWPNWLREEVPARELAKAVATSGKFVEVPPVPVRLRTNRRPGIRIAASRHGLETADQNGRCSRHSIARAVRLRDIRKFEHGWAVVERHDPQQR